MSRRARYSEQALPSLLVRQGFSFYKSITICCIDFTKSAGRKKLMSKIFFFIIENTATSNSLAHSAERQMKAGAASSIFLVSPLPQTLHLSISKGYEAGIKHGCTKPIISPSGIWSWGSLH